METTRHEVAVEMTGVHKWFGDFHVLRDINLTVKRGERIVVCGPSGSGKSTMIRCINRLEEHQQGRIVVDGIELTDDLKRIDDVEWRVADEERISQVENLYRLSVNPGRQFRARNFSVKSEDLELRLIDGSVFTIDTDQGVTGLVITGRGEMRFVSESGRGR